MPSARLTSGLDCASISQRSGVKIVVEVAFITRTVAITIQFTVYDSSRRYLLILKYNFINHRL